MGPKSKVNEAGAAFIFSSCFLPLPLKSDKKCVAGHEKANNKQSCATQLATALFLVTILKTSTSNYFYSPFHLPSFLILLHGRRVLKFLYSFLYYMINWASLSFSFLLFSQLAHTASGKIPRRGKRPITPVNTYFNSFLR